MYQSLMFLCIHVYSVRMCVSWMIVLLYIINLLQLGFSFLSTLIKQCEWVFIQSPINMLKGMSWWTLWQWNSIKLQQFWRLRSTCSASHRMWSGKTICLPEIGKQPSEQVRKTNPNRHAEDYEYTHEKYNVRALSGTMNDGCLLTCSWSSIRTLGKILKCIPPKL